MRKGILLTAVLLAGGAWAIAQDSTASVATDTNNSASSSNTVQGCLSGASGSYTLTDATGAMYQVQGDESQLSANVDKQVEVTGNSGAKASASATNSADANAPGSANSGDASGTSASGNSTTTGTGASATATVSKMLTVTSIRKVADSCTSGK